MKSALFIWGGWDGHQPEQCVKFIAPLIEREGFRCTISDSLASLDDAAALKRYSVIVPCFTCGTLAGEQEKNICEAVASGVGIAGWHGGIVDAFRAATTYQFMTGGQFVAHPGNIIDYEVSIRDPGHAITRGLSAFKVRSEQYYMHMDPAVNILASTTFSGEHAPETRLVQMPVVWTKPWGAGRVAVNAVGHVLADLQNPPVTELTRRCILWAARSLE